jgi:hypothetical protein
LNLTSFSVGTDFPQIVNSNIRGEKKEVERGKRRRRGKRGEGERQKQRKRERWRRGGGEGVHTVEDKHSFQIFLSLALHRHLGRPAN